MNWRDTTKEYYTKMEKKDIATILVSVLLAISGGAISTLWTSATVAARVDIQEAEINRLRDRINETATRREVEKLSDKLDNVQESLNVLLANISRGKNGND